MILTAGGSPPRKTKLPPGSGMPPSPEDADGLSEDDGDLRCDDETDDGGEAMKTARGTATVMQCLYRKLYKKTRSLRSARRRQGTTGGRRRLLRRTQSISKWSCSVSSHRRRIFDHGRRNLDPPLPVDSEIYKAKGRWHHAAEGSQDEVVRYMRLIEAES